MEKKKYVTPAANVVELQNQQMLCLSGETPMDIHDQYTDAEQLSNKNVWGSVIINTSALDKRRIDMVIPVAYDTDLEKAKGVITGLLSSYSEVLKDPEMKIEVHTLADSSINFIVRPWTANADYWTVYWRFQKEIVEAFRANGIEIPYNKLDVNLVKA